MESIQSNVPKKQAIETPTNTKNKRVANVEMIINTTMDTTSD